MTSVKQSQLNILTKTRIDQILVEVLGDDFSRSRIQQLIKDGKLTNHGKVIKQPSLKVEGELDLKLILPEPEAASPQAEDIPLDIIYEDEHLLVINKPVGLVVHPGAGNWSGTLVNALLHHCKGELSGIGGVERPGIVHRLDKETSGLMIVAKNDKAHRFLSKQLETRTLTREYVALVWGEPVPNKGTINAPIGRHPTNRQKQAVTSGGGKEAITHYEVLERYQNLTFSLVRCKLQTGRTHQIRVHMAHIKHWLIGDPAYGKQATSQRAQMKRIGMDKEVIEDVIAFPRQALHAQRLSFMHPESDEEMSFEAPLPSDLNELIDKISQ